MDFRNRMGVALDRAGLLTEDLRVRDKSVSKDESTCQTTVKIANSSNVDAHSEIVSFMVPVDGNELLSYEIDFGDQIVPCHVSQTAKLGDHRHLLTLEAAPILNAGQSKVGVLRELNRKGPRNKDVSINPKDNVVETKSVRVEFMPDLGGSIQSVDFALLNGGSIIYSDNQSLSENIDKISGQSISADLTLVDYLDRVVTDHSWANMYYPSLDQCGDLYVPVRCEIRTPVGTIWKSYRIYYDQARIDLNYRFQWRDVVPKSMRVGRICLNPELFDNGTLFFATTNGGCETETFQLFGNNVRHDNKLENGFTSRGCIGATQGWVVIGDEKKGLGFITQPSALYSIPLLHYQNDLTTDSQVSLSLTHSLGEWDETSHTLWRGHSSWGITIVAGKDNILETTRDRAILMNGGLTVPIFSKV